MNGEAPSTIAASSISRGIEPMNARKTRTEKGMRKASSIRIKPMRVLNSPSAWSTKMVGTTAGGMIRPASTRTLTSELTRSFRR